jgi:hypothetical protein
VVQECFGSLEERWIPLGSVKSCPSKVASLFRVLYKAWQANCAVSIALAPRSQCGSGPGRKYMRAVELYLARIAMNACSLHQCALGSVGCCRIGK